MRHGAERWLGIPLLGLVLLGAGGPALAQAEGEIPPAPRPEPAPAAESQESPGLRTEMVAPSGWPWWTGELELAASVDWSRGDYGDPVDTDLLQAPLQLRYLFYEFALTPSERDFFEVGVSLPFLTIDGPAELFFEDSGQLAARKERESGVGDLRLFGTWLYAPDVESSLPAVETSVSWKIPTASKDKGLGTGEHDVAMELALSKTFGAFSPFASVGYRFLGDSNDFDLRSGPFATLGMGWRPAEALSVGLLYAYTRASLPSRDDAHELIPYFSWRVTRDFRVEPYVSTRITGYAPDVGAGVRLRYFMPMH